MNCSSMRGKACQLISVSRKGSHGRRVLISSSGLLLSVTGQEQRRGLGICSGRRRSRATEPIVIRIRYLVVKTASSISNLSAHVSRPCQLQDARSPRRQLRSALIWQFATRNMADSIYLIPWNCIEDMTSVWCRPLAVVVGAMVCIV